MSCPVLVRNVALWAAHTERGPQWGLLLQCIHSMPNSVVPRCSPRSITATACMMFGSECWTKNQKHHLCEWGKSTLVWCGPQMDALTQNPQEFCPFGPLYGIAIEEPTMGCPQKGALKPTVGFPWPHILTVHLKWPTVWPHRHVSWGANSLKSPSVWISSSHFDHDYVPKGIKLLPRDWLIREVEQAYLIKWQFQLFMFFYSRQSWDLQKQCEKWAKATVEKL